MRMHSLCWRTWLTYLCWATPTNYMYHWVHRLYVNIFCVFLDWQSHVHVLQKRHSYMFCKIDVSFALLLVGRVTLKCDGLTVDMYSYQDGEAASIIIRAVSFVCLWVIVVMIWLFWLLGLASVMFRSVWPDLQSSLLQPCVIPICIPPTKLVVHSICCRTYSVGRKVLM